jgi:hypothetical protein
MDYETPTVEVIDAAATLIQNFAGPRIDGGLSGQSHLSAHAMLEESPEAA